MTRMKGDVKLRYIGSKLTLLKEIENIIKKNTNGDEESFLDLFAGSNAVGNYFKKDYQIYSNDILYFSYVIAKAKIENNSPLTFEGLKKCGIHNPIDYLQNHDISSEKPGYYELNYSPSGIAGRMYLSSQNARRIDFIRNKIDEWKNAELINDNEFYYLLSSLIEAIPFVSNITGTYGAYLKKWDKRALKAIELKPLEVLDNKKNNKVFNIDSNELVKRIEADIVYIDTPYNSRQYAPNYHVLENIARNNKPELKGVTGMMDYKNLKSDYSLKRKALDTMEDLIKHVQAKHIILSYNNEGIISEVDLIELLKKYAVNGNYEIIKIPYRKYKSKIASENYNLYELLIYIQRKEIPVNKNRIKDKYTTKKWSIGNKYLKSPLNYIGGKYRLLKQILPLFPEDIDTFVDLFSGGANVGINVPAKKHIFNDMNDRVNEMFRYFAMQDPESLISRIKKSISETGLSKTNEEAYISFRKRYNENPNPLDLYILISYSYNYQIRFNNSMQFNNPFGRNRSHFSENMEKNLYNFVLQLNKMEATFIDGFFDELDLSGLKGNDFVYLDPPYIITTGNYNDGNRGYLNWGVEQEKSMYKIMDQLTGNKVRWALSNVLENKGNSHELLKEYIEKHNVSVRYLDYNYNNSSYNSSTLGSLEVLVTNYDIVTKEILNPKSKKVLQKQ